MKKAHYGTTEDGQEVDVYTLANDAGMRVDILTFGCVIARLEVPDRRGRIDNVVLGLDSLAGYALRSPHFGAIAGRYANRIARGRFAIDGKTYQLDINAAPNAMHGGRKGFHKVVWQGERRQRRAGDPQISEPRMARNPIPAISTSRSATAWARPMSCASTMRRRPTSRPSST